LKILSSIQLKSCLVFGIALSLILSFEVLMRSWYQSRTIFINPFLIEALVYNISSWLVILILTYKRYRFRSSLWFIVVAVFCVCFIGIHRFQDSFQFSFLNIQPLIRGFFDFVSVSVFHILMSFVNLVFLIILLVFSTIEKLWVITGRTLVVLLVFFLPFILNSFSVFDSLRYYDPMISVVSSVVYKMSNAGWFLWELLRKEPNDESLLENEIDQELGVIENLNL